ncbi:MAG: DUF4437 domain-containing protein [Acidobacteriota bacterium]
MKNTGKTVSLTALEDIELKARFEGNRLKVAVLWGDPATGPVAILLHMPRGHVEPFHVHTSDYHCVVVKGELRTQARGGEISKAYGPGSHVFQPGGVLHAESSDAENDVLAFVYFDGPIDVVHED